MKKLILKKELQRDMLQAAVITITRDGRPVSFAVAIDSDGEPNNKPVLAHVVVMSGMQAIQIEEMMRKVGMITFETIEADYE